MLYVRAGLDRPDVNRAIGELGAAAIAQNAPIMFLNNASGHHAFETRDDDEATRAVIDEVFAFVRRVTAPGYRAAYRTARREVAAAGAFASGNYAEAASTLAELVKERPADAPLRLSYGEALLANHRYADACGEFEHLKGSALGARDRGVPAARSCALAGDADKAVAWLRTIPKRFLPAELQFDPALSSLRGRDDFHALFRP